MKIISWNVNGIRAVYKKGFLDWLESTRADFVCLQETKAQPEQLSPDLIKTKNYQARFSSAIKKGYSGVAIYSKTEPERVNNALGLKRFDEEGRILEVKYPDFTLINFYIPHGSRDKENLKYKLEVYKNLFKYLKKIKDKNIVLVGDFNIAHNEIDLARPKDNKDNIMFTPEERRQIDKLIDMGFIDTFREFNKEAGNHTWWSYMRNDRDRNIGWRIDYIFVSESLRPKLKKAHIFSQVTGSDHCPIGIELDI